MFCHRYAYQIVLQAREMLRAMPSLVDITVPNGEYFTVCGDVHGQVGIFSLFLFYTRRFCYSHLILTSFCYCLDRIYAEELPKNILHYFEISVLKNILKCYFLFLLMPGVLLHHKNFKLSRNVLLLDGLHVQLQGAHLAPGSTSVALFTHSISP